MAKAERSIGCTITVYMFAGGQRDKFSVYAASRDLVGYAMVSLFKGASEVVFSRGTPDDEFKSGNPTAYARANRLSMVGDYQFRIELEKALMRLV